jgi:lipoprotein NlpD
MEKIKTLWNFIMCPSRQKILEGLFLLMIVSLFAACASNYEAPVLDEGEKLVMNVPIVVNSGDSSDKFFIEEKSQQPRESSKTQKQVHEVRRGDNLISIAFEYDLDFRELALANGLTPPYTIFVDQEINLDVSRAFEKETLGHARLGIEVSNSSIARSQGAASGSRGLIRDAIGSNTNPVWQWPSLGRTLNDFEENENKGVDISGQVGDPVFAAGDGDVVFSGQSVQGIGNLVIIRHSDSFLSAYAHNRSMMVSEGMAVKGGEKIAEIGLNSSGVPMLHFEIRVNGKPTDPASLLPKR